LISAMEHHANIVPWQVACEQTGAVLKVIPISDAGELDLIAFEELLTSKTKLLAVTHVSNVLGTINPIESLITQARAKNIPVLVDGAQGVIHELVDVKKLDCDFYVFSSHKVFGPTGVGLLYAKADLLKGMRPYQAGGEMIRSVSFEKTEFADAPQKFEAGTPAFVQAVGFAAALRYIQEIGLINIRAHEQALLAYAMAALEKVDGLTIFGVAKNKAGIISFVLEGIHPHDIATILDSEHIAIRAGHHCAMPLMQRYNVPAMARASFSIYNTEADVHALIFGLEKVKKVFCR
jgi:cysteine desulfurase/selenocysteine lyase